MCVCVCVCNDVQDPFSDVESDEDSEIEMLECAEDAEEEEEMEEDDDDAEPAAGGNNIYMHIYYMDR